MFYGTGDASERNITAFTISRDWFHQSISVVEKDAF